MIKMSFLFFTIVNNVMTCKMTIMSSFTLNQTSCIFVSCISKCGAKLPFVRQQTNIYTYICSNEIIDLSTKKKKKKSALMSE